MRARCASDSCRASCGRPPTSSARRGAPIRSAAAAASGPAGASSQALLPLKPARLGRKYSHRPDPRKRRKQKPSSASATGRSGLPSPAATESPSPAISKSSTLMSAEAPSTRVVGPRDADRGDGAAAVAHPQPHLLPAGHRGLLRRRRAVVEAPGAGGVRRDRPDEPDADPVILGAEIVFLLAVALAGVQQLAGDIDAELAEHVLGPAAAVGARGASLRSAASTPSP